MVSLGTESVRFAAASTRVSIRTAAGALPRFEGAIGGFVTNACEVNIVAGSLGTIIAQTALLFEL